MKLTSRWIFKCLFSAALACFFSQLIHAQPLPDLEFEKDFLPSSIVEGGVSMLTFTLANNTFDDAVNISFTDNLPAGVVVDATPMVSTSCSGTITAVPGSGTITVTGAAVGAMSSCTISVRVTSATAGMYNNTTGQVQYTIAGNPAQGGTASADLNVTMGMDAAPAFSKSFSPNTMIEGAVSTLTFTIDNSASSSDVDMLAFTDNLPAGLVIAPQPNDTSFCTGGTLSAPPGGSTISYTGGSITAGSICTIQVDVTGSMVGSYINNSGDLTSSQGSSGTANATLDIVPPDPPTGFTKSFSPSTVAVNGGSTLTFTIENSGSVTPVGELAFTDALPAGIVIADVPNVQNGCAATVDAPAGGSTITVTDGAVGANSSCTISVQVVGTMAGVHMNTTSELNSEGGLDMLIATADLTVDASRPAFSKSFDPPLISPTGTSTLTFLIENNSGALRNSLSFTDNLPAGLEVAADPMIVNTCNGVVNATPGSNDISLIGGFVLSMSSCMISVDVTSTGPATYENITSDLIYSGGNSGFATAVLSAPAAPFTKSFTDDPVQPGETVTLEFTINNSDPSNALTDITFTDDLDAVLSGLVATGLPQNDVCGPGSVLSGTDVLTLTGGNLGPRESCTFSVTLQVPGGATAGTYPNTSSNISAMLGGNPIVIDAAFDDLIINEAPSITKTFLNNPVVAGGMTSVEFTIQNNSASQATNITFTDVFETFLPGAIVTLPMNGYCGAGSVSSTDFLGVTTFTGGTLNANASCTFSVDVTVPAGVSSGTYTNTTGPVSATINGVTTSGGTATDDLDVIGGPSISKQFVPGVVMPGGTADLEFTISLDANAPGDVTDITFTDDLDAALTGLVATGLPMMDVCGMGSQITGTNMVTFTGGTLSPGGSCTFSIPVQIPMGATPGTYTNTTSDISGMTSGTMVTNTGASADLDIQAVMFEKVFDDMTPVAAGDMVDLEFTITNLSATTSLNDFFFNDDLTAVLPGLEAVGLPMMDVCGMGSSISGTSFLSFTGGSLAANSSCSFTVTVQVPMDAMPGDYVNATGPLFEIICATAIPACTTQVAMPAMDTLNIPPPVPPTFTKDFAPNPIGEGGVSTLTFTIDNSVSTFAADNLDFTDNLPAGVVVATPSNVSTTCTGGTLTAVDGTGVITYTGGSIAAGASCTVQVDVTAAVAGSYANTSGELTSSSGNSGTSSATLNVEPPPTFSKSFAPDIVSLNGTSTLTFTIDNTASTLAATGLDFTDNLPAGVIVATPANASTTCTGGTLTAVDGSGVISYTGGTIGAGASCTISVDVTAMASGVHSNTSGDLTSSLGNSGAATDDLMVDPPPSFSKSFSPAVMSVGGISTLTFLVDNSMSLTDATMLDFTDNLPAGLEIAMPANASTTCTGGTLTAVDGGTSITYSGGTVTAGSTCMVQVDVTATTDGDFTNTSGDLTSSLGNSGPAMAMLSASNVALGFLNCRDANLSVDTAGLVHFTPADFIPGATNADMLDIVVSTFSDQRIYAQNGVAGDALVSFNVCAYLDRSLKVSFSNGTSNCWSTMTFKQAGGGSGQGRSKDVWCFDDLVEGGDIDGEGPVVSIPCGPQIELEFVSDWIDGFDCTVATPNNTPESDTAKIIYREYEGFYKGERFSIVDTITVFRLPAIIAGFSGENTYCAASDTTYCGEGFAGPFMIIPERCDPALFGMDQDGDGVPCDTIYFMKYDEETGQWVANELASKCGLNIHLDQTPFAAGSCETTTKFRLELKQNCYGAETGSICSMATSDNAFEYISPSPFTGLGEPLYLACEFWLTDLDTLEPVAICKGDPFFGGPFALDDFTFNTIRDFEFLHDPAFLGGLGNILPAFDDIVIPDELTMLDTSKAPYSMCFASEQLLPTPPIYLGLNTAFVELEEDAELTFNWDFLLGEFDEDNSIIGVPGAIGLIGYGINGTFYKLVEGIEEPLLDEFDDYQQFLEQVMAELEVDQELCNLNISLLLEDSWGSTTIRAEKGDVITFFGLWVSNSDAKIQFSGQNQISTTSHDCAAHTYVPPLIVKDDWSGIKSVKASIEGIGTVLMEYDATEGCYVSHESFKLPYREDPYKVIYEVADSCHNVGSEICYLQVKDGTKPIAVADKGVTVNVSDKKVWVDATSFDEGSWDNCGINMMLARRMDWQESCVDLCLNVADGIQCASAGPEDYASAVEPVWTDGHDTLWCVIMEEEKDCDPVESHYAKQLEWWCEDGQECSELIYNGWVYDLMEYATLHCKEAHYLDKSGFRDLLFRALKDPNADPNDALDGLIEEKFKCVKSEANAECILPFTFGRFPLLEFILAPILNPVLPIPTMVGGSIEMMYLPEDEAFCGYGDVEMNFYLDEWSNIGGGWSDAVPFSCEDACGPVTVEILVMDYWCNWSKSWTEVWVEDKTPVKVEKDVLAEEDITCKTYKDARYSYPGEDHAVSLEYLVAQSEAGDSTALATLDGIWGGYCKAWVDPYGNYVDIDGNLIDCDLPFTDSVCQCSTEKKQVRVYDDHEGYIWKDSVVTECYYELDSLTFQKGIIAVNCAENVYCEQTVWSDFDACGQGYVFRKWKIWQGCPSYPADSMAHDVDTIIRTQRIWVGNECDLSKYMFDVPADTTIVSCAVEYDPAGSGNIIGAAGPESTGYATYKFDDDCRLVGIGYEDKVFKVVGGDLGCYKIQRTWYFADWCENGKSTQKRWWHQSGYLDKCVQTIVVQDTTAPVCLITGPVEDGGEVTSFSCDYDLSVEVSAGDACGVNSYQWDLSEWVDGSLVIYTSDAGSLESDTTEQFEITVEGLLPGDYQLRVVTTDDCNNENACEYNITIRGGKKPTPVCISSMTATLTPWDSDGDGEIDTASTVIWAEEFNSSSLAACADDSLAYRLEFVDGVGDTTWVDDADSLNLGCEDLGAHFVRMWVISYPSGTADYCDVVMVVQGDFIGCADISSNVEAGDMSQTRGAGQTAGDHSKELVDGDASDGEIPADASIAARGYETGFMLKQNQPNPFSTETTIGFILPDPTQATLTFYDVTGRVLKQIEGYYVKGLNEIKVEGFDLDHIGILYYQLDTDRHTATRKMLIVR